MAISSPITLVVSCAWCGVISNPPSADVPETSLEVTHTICPLCRAAHFETASDPPGPRLADYRAADAVPLGSGERLLMLRRHGTWRGHPFRVMCVLMLLGGSVACAASHAPQHARTMPSPDGCYVQVWEQPGLNGASDFVNGPRRYENLRDLPGRGRWKDRIRSLRLGPTASAVAWSHEQFRGTSLTLTADGRQRGTFEAVPSKIQSLDITCRSGRAE
jgi:hypothetical protein